MTRIISFEVTGNYASFRDPSVTTNQVIYYIPSKSAIVGLVGAIIGVKRGNTLDELYSKEYLEFFSKIKVGIKLCNNPKKIIYFTNHRSLKSPKTKPVKKEILENPKYTIYLQAEDNILDKITAAIKNNKYEFTPYLGHAYCIARISNLQQYVGKLLANVSNRITDCIVLDESRSNNNTSFIFKVKTKDNSKIIIERHLHHFFEKSDFTKCVLKHWIPFDSSEMMIQSLGENKLSNFYEINEKVYCLY